MVKRRACVRASDYDCWTDCWTTVDSMSGDGIYILQQHLALSGHYGAYWKRTAPILPDMFDVFVLSNHFRHHAEPSYSSGQIRQQLLFETFLDFGCEPIRFSAFVTEP